MSNAEDIKANPNRVMVVFAHPVPESFSAALFEQTQKTLAAGGWHVDACDLNQEGFNPVMSCQERRGYHDETSNQHPVQTYVDRVRKASALVFVFPVWNYGYPAILKGFFDKVFLPGVSFKLVDGKVKPALTHIKKAAAITTYGGTRWRAITCGDPPRKLMTRPLRYVLGGAPMEYLALYDMNRASDHTRTAFLTKVAKAMERF